jgi:hypothetical protein
VRKRDGSRGTVGVRGAEWEISARVITHSFAVTAEENRKSWKARSNRLISVHYTQIRPSIVASNHMPQQQDDTATRGRQQGMHNIACRIRRFAICSKPNIPVKSTQREGRNELLVRGESRLAPLTAHVNVSPASHGLYPGDRMRILCIKLTIFH